MTTYFLALFLGTFALEDAALLSAIGLMAAGKISYGTAFWACFLGIAIGDFALYFFGWAASRLKYVRDSRFFRKFEAGFSKATDQQVLGYALAAARFIPGTRLATYTLAGFLNYPFWLFSLINVGTVLVWVVLSLAVGEALRQWLSDHLLFTLTSVFVFFYLFRYFAKNLQSYWTRRIWVHAWRKWMHFEFWPAWLFYIPIVPRYIYLGIKYRSFFLPFYADPFLHHAGLIGESKWDIYKYMSDHEFHLRTLILAYEPGREEKIQWLLKEGYFQYPFILKPDVGQRGFAVRIIRDEMQLKDYLEVAKFHLIIQEYSNGPYEAGVFYIRKPSEKRGQIFSITDKEFPFVIGTGSQKLGDLILHDPRARIMAGTYFERFGAEIERVPHRDEKVIIATCGNHCQGAIFKNGADFKSEALLDSVEMIVSQIPDFYFGRLDIRYRSPEELKQGRGFKVVEINAAGSEATHIWDPQTSLFEAYSVLYKQWDYLFAIGAEVKKLKKIRYPASLKTLLKELLQLNKQEKKLAVSS